MKKFAIALATAGLLASGVAADASAAPVSQIKPPVAEQGKGPVSPAGVGPVRSVKDKALIAALRKQNKALKLALVREHARFLALQAQCARG